MGFTQPTRGHGIFATIMQGELIIPCKEDDEGAVHRTNAKGREVWEIHHAGFEGHLKKAKFIKSNDPKFPDKINLTLIDKESGTTLTISLPNDSGHATDFYQAMKSIDLKKPIKIEPYDYIAKKDGKRKVGLGMTQDGEKFEWSWTRDDIPEWKKVRINGKDAYDKEEQIKFFMKHFNKWVEAKFSDDDDTDDLPPAKPQKKGNGSMPEPEDMDDDEVNW